MFYDRHERKRFPTTPSSDALQNDARSFVTETQARVIDTSTCLCIGRYAEQTEEGGDRAGLSI